MKAETRTIEIAGVTYRLRSNDFNYYAKMEELTGYRENAFLGVRVNASNVLAVLYAAIYAEYATRDEDPPITYRQLGALLDSAEMEQLALDTVAEILNLNVPDVKEGEPVADPPPAPASRSRSRGATRSARSTSASPSASSGG